MYDICTHPGFNKNSCDFESPNLLPNKSSTLCRVRSITPLLMEGFPSNLNDTFTLTRGCAEPMLPMCQLKVKVTVKCQILNKQILDIMSCPLYKPFTNGRISLDVQSPCCPCVSSRSRSQLRSQLKVKYLANKYYTLCRVRSITPLLMEGFPSNLNDTFTLTRECAEPMLPMCQLKVKVTVKGQIFNKQILHIMLCPLYNSFTNRRISFKLEWHIHLN